MGKVYNISSYVKLRKVSGISLEEVEILLQKNKGFKTDIKCDDCNGILIVREGTSKFFGCSNYPKCKSCYGIINKPSNFMHGKIIDIAFQPDTDEKGFPIDSMEDYPLGIFCADDIKMN